ncbi:hypothetical protein R6L23_01015 [Streptomyces sp. SR27]|uniref:hypothetical protein n=1 Tax=Streptomyces sp. SR27 TaxID=3076630 RepID=UPI00295B37D7|nr:hypothetical protein [Streptomyces sp. SR27]MDV9186829.1 hypothetical protein [Streptomyces sp. SR27]
MHMAGDWLTVLDGPDKGKTLPVASVRMFATDNGYYLVGGAGLYDPRMVVLTCERSDGNPCGAPCDDRQHDALKTCDHCRGMCRC